MKKNHVLLCHCLDQMALISNLAEFLTNASANIIQIEHHKELIENEYHVFIRVEWENSHFNKHNFDNKFSSIVKKFNLNFKYFEAEKTFRMALFVSKMNHCSNDILHRHSIKELDCEIPLIISNHRDCEHESKIYNIPYYYLPVTKENKLETEAKQLQLLKEYDIDFCVLARYMQILSPEFTKLYSEKIINIHHSFLPAFEGANPYQRAFNKGVKLIGATSHYVTQDLDEGPIIDQNTERVSNKHTVENFIRIGRDVEKLSLSKAVRYHIEHRIIVFNNKTVIFDN